MRLSILALLLSGLAAPAAAQTGNQPQRDAPAVEPSGDTQQTRDSSGSSTNTPSTGHSSGRNNPSISTLPDNAPSRGTPPSKSPSQ